MNRQIVEHRHTVDVSARALAKIAGALLLWLFLSEIWPVLIIVLLSMMLVATFNPLVGRLNRKIHSRSLAIALVVGLVVSLVVALVSLLVPVFLDQGYHLVVQAPEYARQIHDALLRYHIRVDVHGQVQHLSDRVLGDVPQVLNMLSVLVTGIAPVVTVCVLTVYLLIEGREVGSRLLRLFPRRRRLGVRRLAIELGEQVGGYMRGQLIVSTLAGTVTLVLLLAVGVQEPVALAVLTAVADAVPVIGLLIGLVPCALVTLAISPSRALLVVVVILIYHQIEANLICPKVYGNSLGLSLSTILVSLLIGYRLLGIVGMVLALPIASGLPSIIELVLEWQDTPGEPPPLTPENNPLGPSDGGREAEEEG